MPNYDVGYGKPPRKSRFRSGVSGNPKGRPKRKPSALAGIIRDVLSAPVEYRERGRLKAGTRHELSLKVLVERAIKGDLGAADFILKVRAHGLRYGEAGVDRLQISDWLPDYPGQTADQKTREFVGASNADPLEWWQARDNPPSVTDAG
jgi:hypothetical protein